MNNVSWIDAVQHCQKSHISYVLITVIAQSGSSPRDIGTKMVVTDSEIYATIGGGHLEFEVMRTARELIKNGESCIKQESYPLSAKLGQCCGGEVTILFESHIVTAQHIALFGAGHVAQALVPILSQLPVKIDWFDEREDIDAHMSSKNVEAIVTDSCSSEVKLLPKNSFVLVMTHNHQQDFDIVLNAVQRPDIHYVGMIGSETKAKRFQYRLRQRDISQENIEKLISPVGNLDVPGKSPIEVAISISAQIVSLLHEQNNEQSVNANQEVIC